MAALRTAMAARRATQSGVEVAHQIDALAKAVQASEEHGAADGRQMQRSLEDAVQQ